MLYQITNGTVSAGGQVILSHIDFEIKGKEKIAVVGRNGAGKTTLLRLIAGELELDRDDKQVGRGITSSRRVTVGMLNQTSAADQEKTVDELLLESCPELEEYSRERFAYEMEYDRMFTGFGLHKTDKTRKLSSFSGGEQTKISLIRLLLMKPDILLLDEPTNHLDIPTIEWLEEYMLGYDKAVVFVSHDRFFLDQVVDVVYELEDGHLRRYPGDYTHYRQQKRKDVAQQRKAYEHQQEELQRLNALVEKFKNKPKKAAFARSRKTIMERMERIHKPSTDDVHIFTGELEPQFPGSKWVLEAENLKIGYDKKTLLELSLRVRRGQKIGIIGDNGVGKSTFLRTVAQLIPPVAGSCTLGNHTVMGYFDQQSAAIESDKQVVEHFHDIFPGMTEKDVRQTLGAYLFGGKDASKRVSELSGGERARLILAELLCSRPNLMILDEPTNHMDIQAKETLESAFQAYTGTILFVSHDRYFIHQVADAILVFEKDSVMYYPFGYEHYKSRSREKESENLPAMMQAKEQAMIADLHAVPEAERHRLREYSTEQMYRDWQFRLAAEPMKEAGERVAMLQTRVEELRERELLAWASQAEGEAQWKSLTEDLAQMKQELVMAENQWTSRCFDYYDLWAQQQELQ